MDTSSKDRAAAGASKVASVDELVLKKKDARRAASALNRFNSSPYVSLSSLNRRRYLFDKNKKSLYKVGL
ncbi:hypothetical protein EUTSA_v10022349mg [Eutrema salsugineum]|uniref:Uncharacterized protein n=1 Tax=Eutrema salsugineum TaxID=72664 RepID=V4M0Y0_EUTSA|nr:hypothetical protein EUTSA_v10022349mg [Eutrema salsugineum]